MALMYESTIIEKNELCSSFKFQKIRTESSFYTPSTTPVRNDVSIQETYL